MTAAINGKRRPPWDLSASPRLPLSWFLFKLEPELLLFPLLSHRKHTRSSTPLSPLLPPLFLAAAVSSLPPVKDKSLRPSFFLFWFARGSPSLSSRRLLTPSPPGAVRGSPKRRPIRRRRRSSSPARFPRIQSRPTSLHVVSIFLRPILFLLVLIVARATSPEQPCRPLLVPAADEARVTL
jgi:hypothetical protein